MNSSVKHTVVFLSYYRFTPCYMQQVVENVFSKEIGAKCNLIFLLQSKIYHGKVQKWNNSEVWITPALPFEGIVSKCINKVLRLKIYYQLAMLLRRKKKLIIMVRDMPGIVAVLGMLRKKMGYKVYFQYSAPLGLLKVKYFEQDKSFKKISYLVSGLMHQALLGVAIRRADLIFPITEQFGHYLMKRYGNGNMVPLTMGVDEIWTKRVPQKIMYLEELSKNNFIIGYFGSLSFNRKPDFLLKVFYEFKKKISNCKLLLMGDVACKEEMRSLKKICRILKIEADVIFTGTLDKNTLQDHLQYCKLTLSAIPPDWGYTISSPTKLYESMGHGIPVVANRGIYEQEKVIEESGGGVLVSYNVPDFALAIYELYDDPKIINEMSDKGKAYILENYTYKTIAQKIAPFFTV